MKKAVALIVLLFTVTCCAHAQNKSYPWIAYPSANTTDYGVFHFRKTFRVEETGTPFIVHVSADNRYKLYVNGQRVAYGPAKGDLTTYKYDIVDIGPYLKEGDNVLGALVFNHGKDKPMAFLSAQTAFMLKAENPENEHINSSSAWKVFENPAYDPITYAELFEVRWFYGYYACGPGDEVRAATYPWGWASPEYDDSQWKQAEELAFDVVPWNLVPRNIAMMDSFTEYPKKVRRTSGISLAPGDFRQSLPLTIPPNTKAEILLDFELFTMGYPRLETDGGSGARIQVNYAEALYEEINVKGHRDSVNNLTMYGVFDIFHTDGARRIFEPLWKRAFRYVAFYVETAEDPLTILGYENEFSGYPYPDPATFESSDPVLNEIFETGFQTFRMCSGETYYDTPFYEQLSYGGDNRPIAAISSYNSTDDRLFREVMRLYPQSANRETRLFKSAYPSRFDFDMGTWSLAWIQSLSDYYAIRGDLDFTRQFVKDIEGVLNYYWQHMDEEMDILGPIWNQNFMDWSISKGSIPRVNPRNPEPMIHSILLSLYYAHTLDEASTIFQALGEDDKATKWSELSDRIKQAVMKHGWDEEKKLIADFPDKKIFSQHANILGVLTNTVPENEQEALLERILSYDGFDEYASSYFSFFLYKAMEKTGREDLFLSHLDFYKTYLERGHTTFGETGFASHDRSDCHAWSAHPNYYLLRYTAGIRSADTGFSSVRVAPELGELTSLEASVPHPKGHIQVNYAKKGKQLHVQVELPEGLSGTWEYGGESRELVPGLNKFKQKAE